MKGQNKSDGCSKNSYFKSDEIPESDLSIVLYHMCWGLCISFDE